MEVDFEDDSLRRLEVDPSYDAGFGREVVRAFRKRMQVIRAAPDERDFYALKSLHFEKLKGNREGQHSMRLNQQWRLILRFSRHANGKVVVVISIDDYH
jgi:proteic killer suppression protein